MKRVVLIVLLLLPIGVFAQPHIEFMGVPLGGDLKETVSVFKSKGFYDDEFDKKDIVYGLYGKWWKFDKVHLAIYSPENIGAVSKCSVGITEKLFYVKELISNLDNKYGSHTTTDDLIRTILDWNLPGGNRISMEVYNSAVFLNYIDYPLNTILNEEKKKENIDL